MSRGSRGPSLRWITAALFAVGSLVVPPPSPAQAKVDFGETADKFIITVPIDLIGGEDDIAARWNEAIRDYWNNGPGLGRFKYCGKSVEFVPDIKPIAAGEQGRPDAAKIRMQLVPEGRDIVSNVRGIDPARNSTGTWGSNEGDATIAHEFGHILGLRDEYVWVPYTDTNSNGRWDANEPQNDDLNHNGKRDPGEPTHPIPGFEGSIMAETKGKALQRLIDAVMDRPGIKCWKGAIRLKVVETFPDGGVCNLASDGRVTLIVAESGEVSGTIDVGSTYTCDFGFSVQDSGSMDVAGQLTDEGFTLQLGSSCQCYGTLIFPPDRPLEVPITGPGRAEGTLTFRLSVSDYTYTSSLECSACEEAVG